jgi:hypothetical protein
MGRHTALKVNRSVILLLFAIVASATLSARHNRESNAQGNTTQLLLAAAEQAAFEQSPTTPDAASREPKEPLQHCVFCPSYRRRMNPEQVAQSQCIDAECHRSREHESKWNLKELTSTEITEIHAAIRYLDPDAEGGDEQHDGMMLPFSRSVSHTLAVARLHGDHLVIPTDRLKASFSPKRFSIEWIVPATASAWCRRS